MRGVLRTTLRTWAVCLGAFALVNAVVALADGGVDANLWWLDLRRLPGVLEGPAFLLAGAGLVLAGLGPRAVVGRLWPRRLLRGLVALLFLAAARDLTLVLGLHLSGQVGWGGGPPFSLLVAFLLLALVLDLGPDRARSAGEPASVAAPSRRAAHLRRLLVPVGAAGAFALGLPLALVLSFGGSRYAPADAPDRLEPGGRPALAVVLGAGVRADGRPSLALFDRTRTAIDLYRDGLASHLFLSGGPGPGGQHEVAAMVAMAEEAGVPAAARIEDRVGLSTWATAENAAAALTAWDPADGPRPRTVYATSHAYHTPRVELAFQRHGIDPRTVPALETRPLARRHRFLLREVPGFWFYWLRRAATSPG